MTWFSFVIWMSWSSTRLLQQGREDGSGPGQGPSTAQQAGQVEGPAHLTALRLSWWGVSTSWVKRMVWQGTVGSHVGRMPPTRWPTMARIPLYTSRSSTRSWTDRGGCVARALPVGPADGAQQSRLPCAWPGHDLGSPRHQEAPPLALPADAAAEAQGAEYLLSPTQSPRNKELPESL